MSETYETCDDEYGDRDAYCDMPPGHEGDHRVLLSWPQREPSPPHVCENPDRCVPCTIRNIWGPEVLSQLQGGLYGR